MKRDWMKIKNLNIFELSEIVVGTIFINYSEILWSTEDTFLLIFKET